MKLFTVGHSTATLDAFTQALQQAGIELLVDVRSKPRSRLAHFDQHPLQTAVEETGIRYRFLGDRLGGMPQDPAILSRWRQGRLDPVIITHLRESDAWQDGLSELVRLIRSGGGTAVCIMCSERDPNECHRKAIALDACELIEGLELEHLSVDSQDPLGEIGVQEVLRQLSA